MLRRAFLTALGVAGYGGIGWLVEGCSTEATQANRLSDGPVPSATGSNVTPGAKGPPTDKDEYVPGQGDGGVVVNQATQLPNKNWEARAKQLEGSGALYTEAAPGKWAGKERSHVPTMVVDTMLKNRVTIVVNHVMQVGVALDAGADSAVADAADAATLDAAMDADAAPAPVVGTPEHYVTTIYVKTDTGVVAGLVEFVATDAAPPSVTIVLPPGTKSATAYEYCNIHGLWASKPLAITA